MSPHNPKLSPVTYKEGRNITQFMILVDLCYKFLLTCFILLSTNVSPRLGEKLCYGKDVCDLKSSATIELKNNIFFFTF